MKGDGSVSTKELTKTAAAYRKPENKDGLLYALKTAALWSGSPA